MGTRSAVTGPAELLTHCPTRALPPIFASHQGNPQSSPAPRDCLIEITDEELLQKTGGIVQGMSGSPLRKRQAHRRGDPCICNDQRRGIACIQTGCGRLHATNLTNMAGVLKRE